MTTGADLLADALGRVQEAVHEAVEGLDAEQLTASFYTQLLPTSAHRIRPQFRQMVYQALMA